MVKEVCRGRHLSDSPHLPPLHDHLTLPNIAQSAHLCAFYPQLVLVISASAAPWPASLQLLGGGSLVASVFQSGQVAHSTETDKKQK